MGEIVNRRSETTRRIKELGGLVSNAEKLAAGKACVYMTGSFGRSEASTHSDLDLFIAGKSNQGQRVLRALDEICLKAELIHATRKLRIPEFSGDGRYLMHYAVDELIEKLGTEEDDSANTFTARLLLLLESRPLLGKDVYREVIEDVIAAYWRDYEDHSRDFMPAFLANDILRLWRTFCINYEARTQRVPAAQKAKGKLKNYELKHSRLLTCYSALLYLLSVYRRRKTVTPEDARKMIAMTPTDRLEWLLKQRHLRESHGKIRGLLEHYEGFLRATNAPEEDLIQRFLDKTRSQAAMREAYKFGDLVYEVFMRIGGENRFHRLLVV